MAAQQPEAGAVFVPAVQQGLGNCPQCRVSFSYWLIFANGLKFCYAGSFTG